MREQHQESPLSYLNHPAYNDGPIFSFYAGDSLYDDLIANFVRGLGSEIQSLRSAFAKGDANEISHLAHRLKGTAATFGYPDLASVADRAEACVRCVHVDTTPKVDQSFFNSLVAEMSYLAKRMNLAIPHHLEQ